MYGIILAVYASMHTCAHVCEGVNACARVRTCVRVRRACSNSARSDSLAEARVELVLGLDRVLTKTTTKAARLR